MTSSESRLEVSEEQHRLRLDRFLLVARPDLGRHAIERLLRTGAVRVGGRARGKGHFVKRGDVVEIGSAPAEAPAHPREILHASGILAVAKPPGIPTNPVEKRDAHPTSGPQQNLLSWAIENCLARGIEGRPGVVHRLDRDTSGLVVFSLGPREHILLTEAFRNRSVTKTYLALVGGEVHPRRGTVDLPLARDRSGRMRPSPGGVSARTEYRTLRSFQSMSLLEIRPRTGRMHQIRAHLAAIGHAIAGDPLYGDARPWPGVPRLWLHAESIELPETLASELGIPARIACPLWDDLEAHLRGLGVDRGAPSG